MIGERCGETGNRGCVCARVSAHMLWEIGVQQRGNSEAPSDMKERCKKKKRNVRGGMCATNGEVVTSSFDLRLGEGTRRGWWRDKGGCGCGDGEVEGREIEWDVNEDLNEFHTVKYFQWAFQFQFIC